MASIADQEQSNPASEAISMPKFGGKQRGKNKWRRLSKHISTTSDSPINTLDDGCLMHIFSFLSPLPDRYNTALVCHRWRFLACHPRLWLRVDRTIKDFSEPGVFSCIDAAVSAAKPGDTILIAAGGVHFTSNIQIKKPLCLIGGGELPEETTLLCSRGTDSALELLSTCKITNLTVKAELGCCLLHRSGRLIIDSCLLQCETDPLDYLSCPIVSTATGPKKLSSLSSMSRGDGVTVSCTRIEGGAKAVMTIGTLVLQSVRVIYGRNSVLFWFEVEHQ
ncbi:F-box protein SKIP5-like [Chenopodium quinoa]|uniref:F-box protein SKIP5-like n=1 Tax=Chenopodium quinoa TaxID=63459 RepID=UPI000B77AEEF|nr:F-box protein SKIP5-like [Chenopodium quinoa]